MVGILARVVRPGQPVAVGSQPTQNLPLDDAVVSAGIAFERRFMRLFHTTMHSAAISHNRFQPSIPANEIA